MREATGSQVLAVPTDVSRANEIVKCVERTVAEFGRLDALVCNSGVPPTGTFERITDELRSQAVDLSLLSVVRLIRASQPHLKASGAGRIVNLSSSSIKQPIPRLLLSNTFRLGLVGLVKTCSDEFASHGILVNTVAPGRVDTARVQGLERERAQLVGITPIEQQRLTEKEISLRRYGTPAEFARYVVFLGSPANTYVTAVPHGRRRSHALPLRLPSSSVRENVNPERIKLGQWSATAANSSGQTLCCGAAHVCCLYLFLPADGRFWRCSFTVRQKARA